MRAAATLMLVLGICLLAAGCGGETTKGKKTGHNHDHDHGEGHDHGSDHIGANSAHKIELKDAPFNAKWVHIGDVVTITIVDNEYKEPVAIATKEILIADAGKNEFKIPALDTNDKGESTKFEMEDKKLLIVMDAKPTMTVKVGDQEYKTTIIHIH